MEPSAKITGVVLVMGVLAGLSLSCSSKFRSCAETRSCPPDSDGGSDAGPDGGRGDVSSAGAGGTEATAGGAAGRVQPSGGASNAGGGVSTGGEQASAGGSIGAGGSREPGEEDAGPRDGGAGCGVDGCACGDAPACGPHQDCSVSAGAARCVCTTGYGDCTSASGCETDLRVAPEHCGECGFECAGDLGCSGGECEQPIVEIVAGDGTTCVRYPPAASSAIACWGDHRYGILRRSLTEPQLEPNDVPGVGLVRDLDAGFGHACAVSASSDSVLCWGDNASLQLGTTDSSPGDSVTSTTFFGGVEEVAVSVVSTCARLSSGSVACWGGNSSFERGMSSSSAPTATPSSIPGITDAEGIEAGPFGYCTIRASGRAACWGFGTFGTPTDILSSETDEPIAGVTGMAVGVHYCFLMDSGRVMCGGENNVGQHGRGAAELGFVEEVVQVPNLTNVTQIAAGLGHTCAIVAPDGALYCWGDDSFGQLGLDPARGQSIPDSTTRYYPSPTRVPNIGPVVEVRAAALQTCVRLKSGQMKCFGNNDYGQLGNGTTTSGWRPVNVVGIP